MSLSREEVEKVSLLARLRFSDAELDPLTNQLGQIVDFVAQLSEIDTSNVEPLAHAIELSNVFAEDQIQPSLPREEALANSPKHDDECYRVPAVMGD